jgi:hypothetical protein
VRYGWPAVVGVVSPAIRPAGPRPSRRHGDLHRGPHNRRTARMRQRSPEVWGRAEAGVCGRSDGSWASRAPLLCGRAGRARLYPRFPVRVLRPGRRRRNRESTPCTSPWNGPWYAWKASRMLRVLTGACTPPNDSGRSGSDSPSTEYHYVAGQGFPIRSHPATTRGKS